MSMNDFWTALASVIALYVAMQAAYLHGKKNGIREERLRLDRDWRVQCFTELYAPLFNLFITRHITSSMGRDAPHLHQRLRNAYQIFVNERRPAEAMKAIFDRQVIGPFSEMEYGGDFPLKKIIDHVKSRPHLADEKLKLAVAKADRAEYERCFSGTAEGLLTDEQFQLFNLICDKHQTLARSLGRDG
jgi:hypothetical protein